MLQHEYSSGEELHCPVQPEAVKPERWIPFKEPGMLYE
jgi:hypothetical protein